VSIPLCKKAPEGWQCLRQPNHHGPCMPCPTKINRPDKRPHNPYQEGYSDGYNAAVDDMVNGAIKET